MQKIERSHAMKGVAAVEVLDPGSIG